MKVTRTVLSAACACIVLALCIAAGCTGFLPNNSGYSAPAYGSSESATGGSAITRQVTETWYLTLSGTNTHQYSFSCNDNPSGLNSHAEESYSDEFQVNGPVTVQHTRYDGIDQFDIAIPGDFPATGTFTGHADGASYAYDASGALVAGSGTSSGDETGSIPAVHVDFEWQNGHQAHISAAPLDANGTSKGTFHTYLGNLGPGKAQWSDSDEEDNVTGGTRITCDSQENQPLQTGPHEFMYDGSAIVIHCDESRTIVLTNATLDNQAEPCVVYGKPAMTSDEHVLKARLTPPNGESLPSLWLPVGTPTVTVTTREPVTLGVLSPVTTGEPVTLGVLSPVGGP